MKLALFDLDNTLLPMDSDHGWSQFLIDIGVLDRETFEARNNDFYEQYKAGCLNMEEYLEFQLSPLRQYSREQLDDWHRMYMQKVIQPNIKPKALELVKSHQSAGDICMVITATNSFITRPIVSAFGIAELIATEPEVKDGIFTGKAEGVPSFQQGKVIRMEDWLKGRGQDWNSFDAVYFYSDSINDLPLLEKATHPIAVNPDEKLRAIATDRQWPVMELFE